MKIYLIEKGNNLKVFEGCSASYKKGEQGHIKDSFLISQWKYTLWPILELSHQDGSYERSRSMYSWKNKENYHYLSWARVATVREEYLENDFFQVKEKSGNFVDDQGNLERTWEVREMSGILKINGCGRQSSEN